MARSRESVSVMAKLCFGTCRWTNCFSFPRLPQSFDIALAANKTISSLTSSEFFAPAHPLVAHCLWWPDKSCSPGPLVSFLRFFRRLVEQIGAPKTKLGCRLSTDCGFRFSGEISFHFIKESRANGRWRMTLRSFYSTTD